MDKIGMDCETLILEYAKPLGNEDYEEIFQEMVENTEYYQYWSECETDCDSDNSDCECDCDEYCYDKTKFTIYDYGITAYDLYKVIDNKTLIIQLFYEQLPFEIYNFEEFCEIYQEYELDSKLLIWKNSKEIHDYLLFLLVEIFKLDVDELYDFVGYVINKI